MIEYFFFLLIGIFIFFKFIYFNNLLFFLDVFSDILTYFFRFRKKIVYYNLTKVFKNINDEKKNVIYYKSTKLFFINSLIALHNRFMIDNNYMFKYYNDVKIPNQLREDINNNKVIFVMAHYGIYYDFSSYYKYLGKLSCVYKMKNNIIENLIYNSKNFNNKIDPIKDNFLGKKLFDCYDSLYLVTDQKTWKNNKIKFLNIETNFHFSVAEIHKLTKRSIWLMTSEYDFKNKKISIDFVSIERNFNYSTKKKDITQKIADLITEKVIKNPEQYFWHHDRFRSGLK